MHLGAHLAENMTCQMLNLRLNRCEDNGVSHLFQDMCVNKHLQTLNISCNDLTVRCLPYMTAMIGENASLTELDLSANPLYAPAETEDGATRPLGGVDGGGTHGSVDDNAGGAGCASGATLRLQGTDGTAGGFGTNGSIGGDDATALADGTGIILDGDDGLAAFGMSGQFTAFARSVMRSTALLKVDIRQCGLPPEVSERITTTVKHRELRAKGIPVEAYEKSRRAQEEDAEQKEGLEEDEDAEEGEEGEVVGEGEGGEAGEEKELEETAAEEAAT